MSGFRILKRGDLTLHPVAHRWAALGWTCATEESDDEKLRAMYAREFERIFRAARIVYVAHESGAARMPITQRRWWS